MIAIIDCGGQYTHLIWRNMRDLEVESKIFPKTAKFDEVKNANAYIISGGPSSVTKDDLGVAREIVRKVKEGELNKPILGICLGHQLIAHEFDGVVEKGANAEYGVAKIFVDKEKGLLEHLPKEFTAWVSHFDEVKKIPYGFQATAHSEACKVEGMESLSKPIYGVQFHPEVWHTEKGENILANFLTIAKKK